MAGYMYSRRGQTAGGQPRHGKKSLQGSERKWRPKQTEPRNPLPQEQPEKERSPEPATAPQVVQAPETQPTPPQQAPAARDSSLEFGTLHPKLAAVYASLIQINQGVHEVRLTRFHSKVVPSIPVQQYLHRIATYFQCSESSHILALVYIDRVVKSYPGFVSNLTIHRLLAVASVVATKFQDDGFFSNAHYAKVCGMSLKELNTLEAYFATTLLQWKLNVSVQEFEEYSAMVRQVSKMLYIQFGERVAADCTSAVDDTQVDEKGAASS